MNILTRVKSILAGNANALLDQLEDPEVALNQLLADMRTEIAKVKKKVVAANTEEKMLAKSIEAGQADVEQWQSRAKQALSSGDEDLAREALRKRGSAETKLASDKKQHEVILGNTKILKSELAELEARSKEAEDQRASLIARAKVAKARNAANKVASQPMTGIDDQATVSRAEEKIRRMEAHAEASREMLEESKAGDVDGKFRKLDQASKEAQIDDELARLKAEL